MPGVAARYRQKLTKQGVSSVPLASRGGGWPKVSEEICEENSTSQGIVGPFFRAK